MGRIPSIALIFRRLPKSPKIGWWQPHWSYAPALWREWRRVFHPASVLRVTIATLLVSALIVGCCKAAVPQLQLNFLGRALGGIPAIYLSCAVMCAAYVAIPPYIEVRRTRVTSAHGEQQTFIDASSILGVRLVIFAADRIRLRITYRRPHPFLKERRIVSRTIGVSPRVNLQALCEALPHFPEVWDARERMAARQASRAVRPCAPRSKTQ